MGEAYPHLVERRDEILAAIAREEAPVRADPRCGHEPAGGRHSPSSSGERVVGRRPEDLPADAPRLPGDVAFRLHDTYGFPIDLTVELAAEYGVARRSRRVRDAPSPSSASGAAAGRRRSCRSHAEQSALYGAIQARAGDTRVPGLRDDDGRRSDRRDHPRRDGVRRADRPGRGRGRPRSDAVLRRGRRPGRRPGRAARGGRRQRAVHGDRHAAAARRPDRPPRHAPRTAARSARRSTAESSMPSGGPTRCATTRARTCSTARCATSSASAPARPARS